MEKLKEYIKRVLMKAERPLTLTQIKDDILCEAIKEVTGKTSFEVRELREAVMELINEGTVEQKVIDKPFNAFKIKKK